MSVEPRKDRRGGMLRAKLNFEQGQGSGGLLSGTILLHEFGNGARSDGCRRTMVVNRNHQPLCGASPIGSNSDIQARGQIKEHR
jgi:hypothetical protein